MILYFTRDDNGAGTVWTDKPQKRDGQYGSTGPFKSRIKSNYLFAEIFPDIEPGECVAKRIVLEDVEDE